jgi:hypothetical protein
MTGASFAADVPVTSLYRPAPYIVQQQVEWTGIYFGVNAGYGWGQHTSNVRFVGNPNFSGFTNPISIFGLVIPGPTELSRSEFSEYYKFERCISWGPNRLQLASW